MLLEPSTVRMNLEKLNRVALSSCGRYNPPIQTLPFFSMISFSRFADDARASSHVAGPACRFS